MLKPCQAPISTSQGEKWTRAIPRYSSVSKRKNQIRKYCQTSCRGTHRAKSSTTSQNDLTEVFVEVLTGINTEFRAWHLPKETLTKDIIEINAKLRPSYELGNKKRKQTRSRSLPRYMSGYLYIIKKKIELRRHVEIVPSYFSRYKLITKSEKTNRAPKRKIGELVKNNDAYTCEEISCPLEDRITYKIREIVMVNIL